MVAMKGATRTPTAEQGLAALEALIAGGRAAEAIEPLRARSPHLSPSLLLVEALLATRRQEDAIAVADAAHSTAQREGTVDEVRCAAALLARALLGRDDEVSADRAWALLDSVEDPARQRGEPADALLFQARGALLERSDDPEGARIAWLDSLSGMHDESLDRHAAAAHTALAELPACGAPSCWPPGGTPTAHWTRRTTRSRAPRRRATRGPASAPRRRAAASCSRWAASRPPRAT
jgi:hypothetical protein